MRCLLDKVTARHIMEGMLKLVEGRSTTSAELFALYFLECAKRVVEIAIEQDEQTAIDWLESVL